MAVIGDSVTAGMGSNDAAKTWPKILARQHQLQVHDISQMGATAGSVVKRLRKEQADGAVVIVEIGGNDVLGSTTPAQFEIDLDALLTELSGKDRQVLMFELPLPPFYNQFGRVQRRIAARHNVALVPKRIFLSVIAGRESTLDTIHLSQSGHQLMADRVWRLIESAFNNAGPSNL